MPPAARFLNSTAPFVLVLFIVSETIEGSEMPDGGRESQVYPGVRLAFRRASGSRCANAASVAVARPLVSST